MSKLFCSTCGNELNSDARFCEKCGNSINAVNNYQNYEVANKTNGLALAGFITAMISLLLNFWGIVGIVATVLSGVGLSQVSRKNEKGKGLAIAGLVVGIFSILYGVLSILALAAVLESMGI